MNYLALACILAAAISFGEAACGGDIHARLDPKECGCNENNGFDIYQCLKDCPKSKQKCQCIPGYRLYANFTEQDEPIWYCGSDSVR